MLLRRTLLGATCASRYQPLCSSLPVHSARQSLQQRTAVPFALRLTVAEGSRRSFTNTAQLKSSRGHVVPQTSKDNTVLNDSTIDVQHSEFISSAGGKTRKQVERDSGTEDDLGKKAQDLDYNASDGELIGKLAPTSSHLFKLVVPIPQSLASYLEHLKNKDKVDHPKVIETAYLLHPSQPLSHVSQLILGSLPSTERSARVEFRAVSGQDHDAYPSRRKSQEAEQEEQDDGGPMLFEREKDGDNLQEVRWSLSTDLGDFIKQSTLAQSFKIIILPDESAHQAHQASLVPLVLKITIPTFANRTVYLRHRLLRVTKEIAQLTDQKKNLDRTARTQAKRISIFGLGALIAYWGVVCKLTFFSPLGWDVMEPVTYMSGLSTVIGGYLFFLYNQREVSYSSVLDLSISSKQQQLYDKHGFNVARWSELIPEAKALRKEITKIAHDYDYDWRGQLEDLEKEVELEQKQVWKMKNNDSKDSSSHDKLSADSPSDKTARSDKRKHYERESVPRAMVKTRDGKKVDIDKTIDEASDMERASRKAAEGRGHGRDDEENGEAEQKEEEAEEAEKEEERDQRKSNNDR